MIDKDLLLRLLGRVNPQPPPNPYLREMGRAEAELDAEISQKPTSKRTKRIGNIIAKHNFHRINYEDTPQGPPLLSQAAPQPDAVLDPWSGKILETMPTKYQAPAKALLDHIKNSSRVRWGSDGQIFTDGNVIKGTNIYDLVHSLVRLRPTHTPPHGSAEFLKALESINAPTELMVNASNLKKKLYGKAKGGKPRSFSFSDGDYVQSPGSVYNKLRKKAGRLPCSPFVSSSRYIEATPSRALKEKWQTPPSTPKLLKRTLQKDGGWQGIKDEEDEKLQESWQEIDDEVDQE